MRFTELDPIKLEEGKDVLAYSFLCPCCRAERLVVTFADIPYEKQKAFIGETKSWIPSSSFFHHQVNHEKDVEHITIRPSIDVSTLGHGAWFISNGEVEKKTED